MTSRRSGRLPSTALALVALASACLGFAAIAARSPTYDDLPVGLTAQGEPTIGRPDAPVTMDEWSDYGCPFCRRYFEQTFPLLLDRYLRSGSLRIVFHDYPIAALHPTSEVAHVAARCAGEQGPDRQWALHDALFRRQPQWTSLPDPTAFIIGLAGGLQIDVAPLQDCMASGRQSGRVTNSVKAGEALGLNGTPSFRVYAGESASAYVIDGAQPMERFSAVIDAVLAGRAPPTAAEAEPPAPAALPRWATPEGLAPDPARPGYTLAGDPYKGSPDAPVSVIEFMDFACPPCREHALEVQPVIDQALIDTGRVRWVSKQLPLRVHPQAMTAAVAAGCAGVQGRYWAMHELLFRQVEAWTNDGVDAALIGLARDLGLDVPSFTACFNSRQAIERVLDDMYDARGYVERTPSFAIVDGSSTGSLSGPLPADAFVRLLQKQVESAVSRPRPDPANPTIERSKPD